MAIATSYNVTSAKGARENLESLLKTVEPTETPLYSTLSQSEAPKATLNEWLVDSLLDPASAALNIDGADLDLSTAKNLIDSRARLGNRVATLRDYFSVSRQAEMVDVAPGGQGGLFNASKAKSLIQLKRSIEVAIASGNDQTVGTQNAGATMCGLGVWSNPTAGDSGVTGGNTFDTSAKQAFRAVSGSRVSLGSLTESALRGLLQAVYTASGAKGSYKLYAGPAVMNAITDYTRAAVSNNPVYSFTQDLSGKTLVNSVLTYISDFGELQILPDLFLGRNDAGASGTDTALGTVNTDRAYLIPDDDTVSLKFLEGITVVDLPDNGAGKRSFTEAMCTLRVGNPRSLGSIV
jgi:hypothetical protein